MAIYHLSAKPIQRSAGRSAVAAAAYRSRSRLHDERQRQTFSYTAAEDLVHCEIVGFNGPRSTLWNTAEAVENRKDATTAREFEVALPRELSRANQIELAREFATWLNEEQGCVVDLAIHSGEGDVNHIEDNPHVHMLTTTRKVDKEGNFSDIKISREWSDKKRKAHGLLGRKFELIKVREHWAIHVNAALERAKIAARIDHRSYEDQGIDLLPTSHLGPNVSAMERDRIDTRAGEQNRMIAKLNLNRQSELELLQTQEASSQILVAELTNIEAEIESIWSAVRDTANSVNVGTIAIAQRPLSNQAETKESRFNTDVAVPLSQKYKAKLFWRTWHTEIDPVVLSTLKWVDVESRGLTLYSGEQINDTGGSVVLSKGSDDGIAAAIAIAKAKHWTEVQITGSDEFQVRAALAFQKTGIAPLFTSTVAEERFKEALIDFDGHPALDTPSRSRTPVSAHQQSHPADYQPTPLPELDTESLTKLVRRLVDRSPLRPKRHSENRTRELSKWARDRWLDITANGEIDGLAGVFCMVLEETAYTEGYRIDEVIAASLAGNLTKSMQLGSQSHSAPQAGFPDAYPAARQKHAWCSFGQGYESPGV